MSLNMSRNSQIFSTSSIDDDGPFEPKHSTPIKGSGNEHFERIFDQSSIHGDETPTTSDRNKYVLEKLQESGREVNQQIADKVLREFETVQSDKEKRIHHYGRNLVENPREFNQKIDFDYQSPSTNGSNLFNNGLIARNQHCKYSETSSVDAINSRQSVSSTLNMSTVSTVRNPIRICGNLEKTINFGFVPIGEACTITQKIVNCGNESIQIRCLIENDSLNLSADASLIEPLFEINSVTNPLMKSRDECVIGVKYTPNHCSKDIAKLVIERTTGEPSRFRLKLIGYGGMSRVGISKKDIDDGIVMQYSASVGFILNPPSDSFNRYYINLTNEGHRIAYVYITVEDSDGNKMFSIKPDRFVLSANGGKLNTQRVIFKLKRELEMSIADEAPSKRSEMYKILIYNGEEYLRRKLRSWEKFRQTGQYERIRIDGIQFTDKFENEEIFDEDPSSLSKINFQNGNPQSEFKNMRRCIRINVCDNRAVNSFGCSNNKFISLQTTSLHELRRRFYDQSLEIRPMGPNETTIASPMSAGMKYRSFQKILS